MRIAVLGASGRVGGRVTRDEAARFVVDRLASDRCLRQRPFIGHP